MCASLSPYPLFVSSGYVESTSEIMYVCIVITCSKGIRINRVRLPILLVIVDPGTGGVLSCVLETETTLRNQSQKQETEEQEQSQINKSRKTRVTQRVQPEKEITRETITSVSIPETSQNIIFSSHEITDMS